MPNPDFRFLARRPLFYGALLFCALILLAHFFVPEFLYHVPKNDIYWTAKNKSLETTLTGEILSEVDTKENFYKQKFSTFTLGCASIASGGGVPHAVSGRTRVTVMEPKVDFQYGNLVSVSGNLDLPEKQRNPGGFDYRAYLDRQGIHTLLFCSKRAEASVTSAQKGNFIIDLSFKARNFFSQSLSDGFSEEDAAFLKALLLGEKSDLTVEFEDLFIKTGTLHILAVSGFNIGFLSAAVLFFLLPFHLPKNLKWMVVLAIIWLYSLLVGWQSPLIRASVMATILIFGKLLGRKTDLLNSLGLAAIVILTVNPKSLFDVGFELSFLAVAGLAFFMPIFMEKKELFPNEKYTFWEKAKIYFEELFWVSFVATFVTLPVTVQSFYIVTPLSLLANMIVVPLSFWLFFCGIVYFLTFWWVPKVVYFVPLLMKIMMQVFTKSLFWIGHLPLSCITVGKLFAPVEILLVTGLFYLFFDKKIKSGNSRALLIVLFSLNVFLFQDALRHFDRRFVMTVLDVGQGDSIYFEFPKGGNLLIDAGKGFPSDKGRRVVMPFLKSKGIRRIDAVIFSHSQFDHIGGFKTVFDEFSVKNVFDSKRFYDSKLYQNLKGEIIRKKCHYLKSGRGMQINGFGDTEIEILNPDLDEKPSKNINNDSVVLKIIYGKNSFLLTGDIEYPAMKSMMDAGVDLKADVLKVPHHGAKLNQIGKDFVEKVNPKISIISLGTPNPFGHPRAETLKILSDVPGNRIFRTDERGAIIISSDENRLKVNSP